MKPSERIYQIHRELGTITAIIQYLDEEYEKNKPCEHKSYQVLPSGNNVCMDCDVIFIRN